ncbi:hypothetical protein B0T20DRAFT_346429 [Sordaria brevicollis]|uniref:Uncharacterized protein n=1 Tax=Sordaria brevicollis TaxID=83679 RepID=A0AAE0PK90_SORBR|nr:hypothetical protein B0T20DRAFT_346429 [Sordaria brevicollis]
MSEENRYGARDELVPGVEGRTALKRRKKGSPYFFRGTVVIAPDNGVAITEALNAMRLVPTSRNYQVCIFTDASFDIHTGDGGYALAYNSFGPKSNTSSGYIQLAKGWPALGVNDNHEGEALAIAQSIREAIQELTIIEQRVMAREASTSDAGGRVEVSVRIFSDSQTVLKRIKAGKFPKDMKGTGHAIILMSEKLSERFGGSKSKLKVNLVVHYIPGHHPHFPQHQKGTDSVYEEVRASRQHRADRVARWKEAEEIDESQHEEQQLVEGKQQEGQQPQDADVQQYYEQSLSYWEQLGRWQEWQRAHGHPTGRWLFDHNAKQWVWQWDSQGSVTDGNGQSAF